MDISNRTRMNWLMKKLGAKNLMRLSHNKSRYTIFALILMKYSRILINFKHIIWRKCKLQKVTEENFCVYKSSWIILEYSIFTFHVIYAESEGEKIWF